MANALSKVAQHPSARSNAQHHHGRQAHPLVVYLTISRLMCRFSLTTHRPAIAGLSVFTEDSP